MKKLTSITGMLLLAAVVLSTSCSKVTSEKKLDGKWNLTAGTYSSTQTEDTDIYTTTSTYDAATSTWVITSIYSPNGVATPASISSSNQTVEYTFDKKAGTYIKVTASTDLDTNSVSYYNIDTTYQGSYDRQNTSVETTTETGTFTLTGGTGEIETNSQIVLLATGTEISTLNTYVYLDSTGTAVALPPVYTNNWNGFESVFGAAQATSTIATTSTVSSSEAVILTVTETKKDDMTVSQNSSYSNTTAGADAENRTTEMSMTLTKAE